MLVVEGGVYGHEARDALLQPGLVDILVLRLDRDRSAVQAPAHIRRRQQGGLLGVGQKQVLIGRRLEVAVVGSPHHRTRGLDVVGQPYARLEVGGRHKHRVAIQPEAEVEHYVAPVQAVAHERGQHLTGIALPEAEA